MEDSDHVTNATTANITVLKVTDYPPEANAGQDVIVYLPRNNLTLNGNLSTDDRGIVSWEWTKSPSDQDKAVDMQVSLKLICGQFFLIHHILVITIFILVLYTRLPQYLKSATENAIQCRNFKKYMTSY